MVTMNQTALLTRENKSFWSYSLIEQGGQRGNDSAQNFIASTKAINNT